MLLRQVDKAQNLSDYLEQGASLGNFPIFPNPGCPNNDLNLCTYRYQDRSIGFSNETLIAQAGYFSIDLVSGIKGEITVTNHTALYRFSFPASGTAPMIFADLIDLPQSRSNGTALVNTTSGRITGSGTFNPSFGIGNYDLHFCADFSGADIYDTGVFVNDRAGNDPQTVTTTYDGVNDDESYSAGAFTRFAVGTTSVIARVGVSFISVDQACSNGETEIPTFDFDGTKTAAQNVWKKKLGVISVDATGVSADLQTVFWSGAYRALLSPQDYTGENPLWESTEPYYDSYYWYVRICVK